MSSRYHFNLTNDREVIRDEDGIELSDVRIALVHAFETIEELRNEDPASLDDWTGWRLEIIDDFGRTVHSIPLDSSIRQPNALN